MLQWKQCKEKAGGALLLFRLGDFYEAFHEDAEFLAAELELTLTKRQEIPMCGVPVQTIEGYMEKLIAAGHLVAIADQIEDAKQAKGIVKRDITKIISPATHISSSLAVNQSNNFIASIEQINSTYALALLDLSTGECFALEVESKEKALDEIYRRDPTEILVSAKFANKHSRFLAEIRKSLAPRINVKPNWLFDHKTCYAELTKHLNTHSLDAFGLSGKVEMINAAGALFNYLINDMAQDLSHVKTITPLHTEGYMLIDRTAAFHLELLQSGRARRKDSLLSLLDHTKTPMGARLLRNWVAHPLIDPAAIGARQDAIAELMNPAFDEDPPLSALFKEIRDVERLAMKAHAKLAGPRDLVALGNSLSQIPAIRKKLSPACSSLLQEICANLVELTEVTERIANSLQDYPPIKITEGNLFKKGVIAELDELREMRENNQIWLANYQANLRESLDIKTLKVNFNNAFGYYIEVSRAQSSKMPDTFHRKQTLVNAERFISPELKEYERKILSAEERIQEIEYKAFTELRSEIASHFLAIQQNARALARLDALFSLKTVALEYDYKRPTIDNSTLLHIEEGRHPIVEKAISRYAFVANDTHLDCSSERLAIITGPNMAGKSTYIRQVAMIVIMAQIGSFIPAKSAHIGIIDKVFSRIGASDDLSRGQSTFMVEMTETANILNNASARSLVVLDEIGRGTSTYDGIAIASAVAQYLHSNIRAKTLFATHYSELTKLSETLKGIKNYRVAVEEQDDHIVFLHKIMPGESDRSYGVQVAKLSGLPAPVIEMAKKKLHYLEKNAPGESKKTPTPPKKEQQYLLFPLPNEEEKVIGEIKKIDVNKLTPIEALQMLSRWKKGL